MSSLEFFIAKRYLWSKRRHPFVGVVSTISILGIAVGVAALITVLGVMDGFDEDLKSKIIGTRAHLVIEKEGEFLEFEELASKISRQKNIQGVAPYIEGQALFKKNETAAGVLVRGVDPTQEKKVSKFYSFITQGTFTNKKHTAVLGIELAKRYGVTIGSDFELLTQSTDKPIHYTVEGIFSCGIYDYDANLLFLNLADAQELFQMNGSVSGLSIYLSNADKASRVKTELKKNLGYPYFVRTWMDLNKTLFGALALEKTVMFLILALIIFVACLNIAGSLTIMVMDKTKDIGILMAIGVRSQSIMKIFAIDGLLIGSIGAGVGLVLGLAISFILKNYSFIQLPKEIYYFEKLPVNVNVTDVLMVTIVAIFLSFLSAIYPARMAGKLEPVKALRYE